MRPDHPKKGPTSLFPPSSSPHHPMHAFEMFLKCKNPIGCLVNDDVFSKSCTWIPRNTKETFQLLGLIRGTWFTCQHDMLLSAKKAQVVVLWLLTFQKSRCFVNKSQCWVGLVVVEFATRVVLPTTPLTNVNPQWSTSRWLGLVGKTNSSS
jgi:hypothetical protein